jgi:hypothetical protein
VVLHLLALVSKLASVSIERVEEVLYGISFHVAIDHDGGLHLL